MEIKLTTSEIRTILQGCQHTLRLVGSSRDYRNIQSSQYFSTSKNVVLNDAFNILGEIVDAIDQVEQINQQGEPKYGAGN
ncbi:hypothetical protein ACEYW6_32305 [Nostoc sp. UIC 10607]|jgi:cyclophilin family peptidyl-prolyl cis-trans isomerase|uniref:hypothetical protein n=2 Tax=Nostoc TaxID=1177 RepID=UPI0016866A8C|nr:MULTISPECIES: hypothetical protein [unclassified Nostoc]MBD2526561.1 hypothetical protein [Nostoc sp. FACHB-133]MDZ8070671.1 hypothetical protein [Nostoc sp. DedQUE08]